MLKSNLCDYIDAYIVVTGNITFEGARNRDRKDKSLTLKKIMHQLFLAFQR